MTVGIGLLIGLGQLLVATVHAVTPLSMLRLSEYQKQNWASKRRLPENNVRMIVQRPDGALVLATASGPVTFDGLRFQNEPTKVNGLMDNEAVNAIAYGSAGNLWLGTDGRGLLHQTRSGTVNVSEQVGLHNERIRMLRMDSQGVLWIATERHRTLRE